MNELNETRTDDVELVLASGSPRRKELLENLGLTIRIIPSNVDEQTELTDPVEIVTHLAVAKAKAVCRRVMGAGTKPYPVLAADTIVVLDGRDILGKPSCRQEASTMLMRLSGRVHEVLTGVALVDARGEMRQAHRVSRVFFRTLDPAEVEAYVQTGEPMDKAGAYALQGIASAFVERVEGCYTNIIGLPVPDTIMLLRKSGVRVLGVP